MSLVITDVKRLDGTVSNVIIHSPADRLIDGSHLILLPALIDPHVHFRIPGASHKEDWMTGARAAIAGGVTTVFDMPNNTPVCSTLDNLLAKKKLISEQLQAAKIPLRYYLYFGADKQNLTEIPKVKHHAIGIKIFMGSSTGDLLIDDDATLDEVFRMAADLDMIVSVHAEDESIIRENKLKYANETDPSVHSRLRSPSAAIRATERAIALSDRYGTRLCILHMSTKEEVELIRKAKKKKIPVYAEAAPHHLFLTTQDYASLGTLAQMNPPLREPEDQAVLWTAINDGTIDFIGTDHAPHLLSEKNQPYGKAPSGVPGIEHYLSLLLNAVNQGKLTLSKLVELTRTNIEKVFKLPTQDDVVLIDRSLIKTLSNDNLKTKCSWSPYAGLQLQGSPIYTIIQGQLFSNDATHL